MSKNRLEAFSDGVLAIIITIMVLEMKAPEEASFRALLPLLPQLAIYLLSFFYMAIYWVNHHNITHALPSVNFKLIWTNMAWLFTASLIPLATAWVGKHPLAGPPLFLYGLVLALTSVSFLLLQHFAWQLACDSQDLRQNMGTKGFLTLAFNFGIALSAFVWPVLSWIFMALVAVMWFLPDKRARKWREKNKEKAAEE
ncbi:membrane protein [Lactobacillus nasalidis]|uniref:Membrane protein n=1 Tax=Lactobacillus nasalidis TaxID=2797258 RepID=A0ABQ3WBW1_9LACO|nr:TMEM175 family protein [Lactobacillus nasalidis]GHV97961.1 membrane protein [Lactobacillus nasalidis]GHW00186.1 membrane protein [Lactobacillus nasalidis]GHW01702.1 membrane protein [Lactobacillus nasalidis]